MQTLERERQYDKDIRRYYDTVTWLAEVLPGSMRTPVEYIFDGCELYANDGSGLGKIFHDSIERAKDLPGYELRRRYIEQQEYFDMVGIMKGDLPNTMVVISDFPPELMQADKDVGGYNVSRKQTMLRVINKTGHHLKMYSQSLDLSDRSALENIYMYLGFFPAGGELLGQRMHLELDNKRQQSLIDELTNVYDSSLEARYGDNWHAGIRNARQVNTYDFVCQQSDLINAYLSNTSNFTGGDSEYNLAAAMRERFVGESARPKIEFGFASPVANILAYQEMVQAGQKASARGEEFSACGVSLFSAEIGAVGQLEGLGYGSQTDKLPDDKFGSRYFKCPKLSCSFINERPKDRLIPRCKKCGADVSCK